MIIFLYFGTMKKIIPIALIACSLFFVSDAKTTDHKRSGKITFSSSTVDKVVITRPSQFIEGCHSSPYWRNMYYAMALMSVVQYTVDEAYTWETTHADPNSNQIYYCYEIKYH